MDQKISVIIPTRNRKADIRRCLDSIALQSIVPDEVIIVDSSDTLDLCNELSGYSKLNIKCIHTKIPGTSLQRNIGIKESHGEILVFSDDDMIWDKNFIHEIIRIFSDHSHENIGGVTGKLIEYGYGIKIKKSHKFSFQFIQDYYFRIFLLLREGDGYFQYSGNPTFIFSNPTETVTKCEFLFGGCMAFRREVIEQFMFDENLHGYGYGDDDDIAYRVSRKYQNYYVPSAKMIHGGISASTAGSKKDTMKKRIANTYYLFKKNFPQDLTHRFAFWWSVFGLFIWEAIFSLIRRDSSSIRGMIDGLNSIYKGNELD